MTYLDRIDKVKSQEELIGNFSDCIQQAKMVIPEENWKSTKIFLGATGGMRLLQ